MKKYNIELHSVDDWEVLYVNGVSWDQRHSSLLESFIKEVAMNEPCIIHLQCSAYWNYDDPVGQQCIKSGRFPNTLLEFKELAEENEE
jgi:hypothetical protein